jgi:hypothetical protein
MTITTSTPHFVSPLVPGPYGFLVLRGWTMQRLTNSGGPASFAHWTNPSGPGRIDYEISGGEVGTVYNRDRSANIRGALQLVGCAVTTSTIVAVNRARFTCAATSTGLAVDGAVVVDPYHQGWRALKVSLPSRKHDTAMAILVGLR